MSIFLQKKKNKDLKFRKKNPQRPQIANAILTQENKL